MLNDLIIGGGCFWCVDGVFRDLKGVEHVESGYAGGHLENPTYQAVCSGTTGHAEVVKITFDPEVIPAEDLLRIFFTVHDPTTLNRQGGDVGTQYRSVIFYRDEAEEELVRTIIQEIDEAKIWPNPIVTTIEPLNNYYVAEEYHQDYYRKFETSSFIERLGMNAGYCQNVVEPKVKKFRKLFANRLKD